MTSAQVLTPRGYWRAVPNWERRDMTVCIAAACEGKDQGTKAIVLCSDWRISSALGSAETMLKIRGLAHNWWLMISGIESDANTISLSFRRGFAGEAKIDDINAPTIVRKILNARKREKIEEFVMGKYAIGYDDFLAFGKDKLPTDLYREAVLLISEITIGCSCIVAGFDGIGHPFILETDDKCRVLARDDFATIGEGAYLAQAALLQRGHISSRDLAPTVYCVYEAKRYAENVTSVGDVTSLQIIDPSGKNKIGIGKARQLSPYFKKFGPQELDESVDEILNFLEEG